MTTTILALHGFTWNGAVLQAELEPLLTGLGKLVCLDAPHQCSPGSVDRLYERLGGPRRPPPHLCWWDASDDGREYRGWPESRERLRAALAKHAPAVLLGFSQGAIAAAAMAALRETAGPRAVVLIGGTPPRADDIAPLFAEPIRLPSLHVWGERDPFAPGAAALAEHFDPATRTVAVWPGSHTIPKDGAAAAAIVEFLERQRG